MHAIVFRELEWSSLIDALALDVESAAVLIAGRADLDDGFKRFLVRQVMWVPGDSYYRRDPLGLEIRSTGYVPAIGFAANDSSVPIFLHTHPGGSPRPSLHDDEVDAQLQGVFRARSRQDVFVSLIVGGTRNEPEFTGRLYYADGRIEAIERVRVIGDRWRILSADEGDSSSARDDEIFDRQIRAFGTAGHRLLRGLHIGVVGVGGTGSAVCEQLIRLGVGKLTVIDPDIVTVTNLTRIHESHKDHVGIPKVSVVADAAAAIATGTLVETINESVTAEAAAMRLRGCDVVFGCTDDHAGRAVLSRLSYWYLVPLIDCGFVIMSTDGTIDGLFGRVTTTMPGEPCLVCRRRVDPDAVRNQLLSPEERSRLIAEGYAPELGEPDPSVVTYTTLIASFAVNELLDRLIGYGTSRLSEILLRLRDRKLTSNRVEPRENHYCADIANWGRGDSAPRLGQVWL